MSQKVAVTARLYEGLLWWLQEYAEARGWSVSLAICTLLVEAKKDVECREMIRKADEHKPQESAQEFLASLDARVERKRDEIAPEGWQVDAIQAAQDEADEHATQTGAIASY